MNLNFGVVDLPYADASYKEVRRKKPKSGGGSKTTGEVAEILEDKYHVMEVFFEFHKDEILADIEKLIQAGLDASEAGANIDLSTAVSSKIEARFREFLSSREMDGQVAGVATEAAKKGVSHRFAHPYAKRAPRPSFIDTGLYEGAFRAWLE